MRPKHPLCRLLRAASVGLLVLTASAGAKGPPDAPLRHPEYRELLRSGRINELLDTLNQRIRSDPSDAEAHHFLCRAYYAVERWDAAVNAAEHAVASSPYNATFHLWLGRAYGEKAERSNMFSAASLARKVRQEFERAVQLDPGSAEARSDLAEFYIEAPAIMGGGREKALAQSQALERMQSASSHWVKARISEKEADLRQAEAEYKKALAASDQAPERWLDLASFYRRQKRLPEMESAIQRALTNDKPHTSTRYDAAAMLFRAGRDFAGAIHLLRAYIVSESPSEDAPLFAAHYLLGALLEKQGDRKGAAAEYRTAVGLARDYDQAAAALKRVGG